uniref:Ig-like domain-containing protein n=1 Tax=Amphilophus citrinellus TaxID=61819 RepID=A0A3Q0QVF2_AMPCI
KGRNTKPPSFVKIPQPVEGLKGKDVVLYCEMCELIPKWFKDGVELASGRKYKISFSRMISSLNVLSAEKIDSGEYTFEVMNEVGKDLSKINLTVLGINCTRTYMCLCSAEHTHSITNLKADNESSVL